MTTSFSRTREQLARLVQRKLGALATGAADVSADMDIIYEAMDLRLKEIHRLGVFWRKVTSVPVSFSLTASIVSASAGAGDILFPLKITYTNGSHDDPVRIVGYSDYAAIQDKTRSGNPEQALWKGGTEFLFYPVPSANGTAKLLYEKIADDTAAATAPDVEVSMLRWLKDIIAYDLSDEWGIDEVRIRRWKGESEQAERNIRKLAVQRTDYAPVQVDDYDDPPFSRETDYGQR